MSRTGGRRWQVFSKDQVRYLNERPWLGALRQDANAAKGNVYMPGSYVLAQLSHAFGFEGWSYEVIEAKEVHFGPTKTKSGGEAWRLCYFVRVRLDVQTPGGRVVSREGHGADEAVSSNMLDVWAKAPAAALTHALKGAAITFGQQFGLGTVRAAKGPGGTKVDWRTRCQEHHPRLPDIFDADVPVVAPVLDDDDGDVIEVDGVAYDARTGVEKAPQAAPRPAQAQPVLPPQSSSAVETLRPLPPTPAPAPAPVPQVPPPAAPDDPERRRVLIQSCRALFRERGTGTAQRVFGEVAGRFGFTRPMADLGHAQHGASVAMLEAFEAALRGA